MTVSTPSEADWRVNSGAGPLLVPLEIGHASHLALVDPDTAFWVLARRERLPELLRGGAPVAEYRSRMESMAGEMARLRFGLRPSAVYFNPTDRCNLDCTYCYIPRDMRQGGQQMPTAQLLVALERLLVYFGDVPGRKPRVIFHGAEPLLNVQAMRAGIEAFSDRIAFGVQTNATLLDEEILSFLMGHHVSIGLSLDGPTPEITHRSRKSREGRVDVHGAVMKALTRLAGYPRVSVIVTLTRDNADSLSDMVALFHEREIPACLLNLTRCTQPAARQGLLTDQEAARVFLAALDRSHALFQKSGRKLIIANFANILLAILAPTARRLMCDISPCGGGRAFFAVAANGDLFPCSEFIGLPEFRGGNLFGDGVEAALASEAFSRVTGRNVDRFAPCGRCAIRHYCGAPCPAEAHAMNGGLDRIGAYCGFYEEQVRYAFRLIADGKADDFLWEGWDRGEGMETVLDYVG